MELRGTLMVGGLMAGLALGGCATSGGQSWTLKTSARVPAATGQVSVNPGKDGNQRVTIQVARLADPTRVFSGANAYVVWVIPQGSAPENVGVLPLDKDLKGTLQIKTPFRAFDVAVTAEPSPTVKQPNENNRVMSASVRLSG